MKDLTDNEHEFANMLIRNDNTPHRFVAGGLSLEPVSKLYKGERGELVFVCDFKSMYPKFAIALNLSFDTMNCDCCADNPDARLNSFIVNEVNAGFAKIIEDRKKDNQKKSLLTNIDPWIEAPWVCQKHKANPALYDMGAYPQKAKELMDERKKYKKLLEAERAKKKSGLDYDESKIIEYDAKQQTFKIMANSIYGELASKHFAFKNHMAANAITAAGRYALKLLKGYAEEAGYTVCFGFTDSTFLTGPKTREEVLAFLKRCEDRIVKDMGLNPEDKIEIELQKIGYRTLIMDVMNKYSIHLRVEDNSDAGIKEDTSYLENLDGTDAKNPAWIHENVKKVVGVMLHSNTGHEVIGSIRETFRELDSDIGDRIAYEDLQFKEKVGRDPEDYKSMACYQYKLAVQADAKADDIIIYYKSYKQPGKHKKTGRILSSKKPVMVLDPTQIDTQRYKDIFWEKIKRPLAVAAAEYNLDVKELRKQLILRL